MLVRIIVTYRHVIRVRQAERRPKYMHVIVNDFSTRKYIVTANSQI